MLPLVSTHAIRPELMTDHICGELPYAGIVTAKGALASRNGYVLVQLDNTAFPVVFRTERLHGRVWSEQGATVKAAAGPAASEKGH